MPQAGEVSHGEAVGRRRWLKQRRERRAGVEGREGVWIVWRELGKKGSESHLDQVPQPVEVAHGHAFAVGVRVRQPLVPGVKEVPVWGSAVGERGVKRARAHLVPGVKEVPV